MPRKYARKPSPTNAPTDPVSLALLPMINAAVDARIAQLMGAWLAQHAPQPVHPGEQSATPEAPQLASLKSEISSVKPGSNGAKVKEREH